MKRNQLLGRKLLGRKKNDLGGDQARNGRALRYCIDEADAKRGERTKGICVRFGGAVVMIMTGDMMLCMSIVSGCVLMMLMLGCSPGTPWSDRCRTYARTQDELQPLIRTMQHESNRHEGTEDEQWQQPRNPSMSTTGIHGRAQYSSGGLEAARAAQAFFTNSDLSFMAPRPSILQSML
ncbi:MAG TPA: hypothetical protein VNQ81_02270 [Povalibacter sp.]|nr:hypothetical protein [Povalibacter sp.]